MRVVHPHPILGEQEDVAAIHFRELSQRMQGVIDAHVDAIGGKVDEMGGNGRDQVFEADTVLQFFVGPPVPGFAFMQGLVGLPQRGQIARQGELEPAGVAGERALGKFHGKARAVLA